ncbi:MAG: hypothetical protein NVSMB66_2160 [Candidatus Doudnabacteria bacterium]
MTWIKKTYLYAVSLVSLVIIIIGATMLVNLGLKAALGVQEVSYPQQCSMPTPESKPTTCDAVFEKQRAEADKQNQIQNKKRDVAQALAFLVVGTPVFWYHWKLARQES